MVIRVEVFTVGSTTEVNLVAAIYPSIPVIGSRKTLMILPKRMRPTITKVVDGH